MPHTRPSTASNRKLTPIMLVPGLCSTKLNIVNDTTGAKERAWVSAHYIPKSRMGEKMINDVWGKPTEDGHYKSFIEDVGHMQVLDGFEGCSHLAQHWGISVIHAINPNFMLGRYFTTLKRRLKKHGYVANANLFCHSYDWRQPLTSDAVLGSLRRRVLKVLEQTKSQRLILIGHSHGALLVRFYMQEYDDWYKHIHRFIAIGPPYDNSSAYMAMSLINGFALKIPFIKNITARNFQASSSVPAFLGPAPVVQQLEDYGVGQYIPTCIFVKKVKQESTEFARQIGVTTCDPGPTYCTDSAIYQKFLDAATSQDLSLQDISVDLTKYNKKFPDLSSLLLARFSEDPTLIHAQYEKQALRLLLANVKYGALRSKTTGKKIWSSNMLYVDTLLTPRYTIGVPTREAIENRLNLWDWEVYTSWVESADDKVPYTLMRSIRHPWFQIYGDRLLLRDDAPYRDEISECRVGDATEVVRWSERPDILQHAYANSIYSSFRDIPILRDIFEEAGSLRHISTVSNRDKDNFIQLTASDYKAAISDLRYKWRLGAKVQQDSNNSYAGQPIKQTRALVADERGSEGSAVDIVTLNELAGDTSHIEVLPSLHGISSTRVMKGLRLLSFSGGSSQYIKIPRPPWTSLEYVTTTRYRSVLSLMQSLNRPGSLEDYLFKPFARYWDDIYKVRTKLIRFPEPSETNFRYFAVCGSGCQTPLHVVYNQPVGSYHELCTQIPTTINSDGDGTVLLHSALSDGFPADLVIDRVIVKNLTHFMLIHDKSVWKIVEQVLFAGTDADTNPGITTD